MTDPLLLNAIANNISWCSRITGHHGGPGTVSNDLWMSLVPAPPFYPNIITQMPGQGDAVKSAIARCREAGLTGLWGIKDSFSDLDLQADGFEKMVQGHWFVHDRSASSTGRQPQWTIIKADKLTAWVSAWHGHDGDPPDVFRPALLEDDQVSFFANIESGKIVAGGILDRSNDVASVSNWFDLSGETNFPSGLAETIRDFSTNPIVCWSEHPASDMRRAGFSLLGPMSVWISQI